MSNSVSCKPCRSDFFESILEQLDNKLGTKDKVANATPPPKTQN
jgi:hypothetical protein